MSAAAILKLQDAGFSVSQVTAIAELVDNQSASKADLESLGHRLEKQIAEGRSEAKSDLESVEHRLDLKITDARAAAELRSTGLEGRITLLQWMIGFTLAFEVLIFGRLFLK